MDEYKVAAILNTASGTCTPECADEIATIFSEAGLRTEHIWAGNSSELEGMFEKFEKSGANVLVVLGGDGTIRSAAVRSSTKNFMLVPLPGGTMNVLPHALYGTYSWQEVLRAVLKDPKVRKISGGEVNGERFYISAICGSPALFAHVREAVREARVGKALLHARRAFGNLFRMRIRYYFTEEHGGIAEAVTVTCPLVTSALDDNQKVFESAVINLRDAIDIFELATTAAFGKWREANNVATIRTPHVKIMARKKLPLILDGELAYVGRTATFNFIPEAITVLVPGNEILH